MTPRLRILLVVMVILGIFVWWDYFLAPFQNTTKFETVHYTIFTTATQSQTAQISEAAESLYTAYTSFFKDILKKQVPTRRLKMRLYRDRQEFSQFNKSFTSWAEAYYQAPYCYSYYPVGETNPYHWMLHEAAHQLNNEIAHLKIPQWIDEGLADYFGTSKLEADSLLLGRYTTDSYPVWLLKGFPLSGNINQDIKGNRIIPLSALITGIGGPDINNKFNLYYIHWWSLTHFLFHYKDGIYSQGYRKVIEEGGTLEKFNRYIGPVDRIQHEWYEYLRQIISDVSNKKMG